MPIFEYECTACGKKYEKLIIRDVKPECPKCKAGELTQKKLISTSSFRLYGDGFEKRSHKDTGDFA